MTVSQHVVIIGGGIIGAATAAELSGLGHRVTVIEKEDHWAAHQTGHNSGVIHAGPYYAPGSLKARMCIAGNASMVAFAQEHGIAHDVCGKLIVATTEAELPRLNVLAERAAANGTPSRLVSAERAREREPHVAAVAALEVDSTGIIDYKHVNRRLIEIAAEQGAELILGSTVTAITVTDTEVVVQHDLGTVTADYLVNCAGLQSDRVARLAGLAPEVRIVPFRGEYFELVESAKHLVKGLIYPVPDPN
ncbi:MAG: L-2-hydroxyglutarate oxidase, partial [Rhodoglobus sp.]